MFMLIVGKYVIDIAADDERLQNAQDALALM